MQPVTQPDGSHGSEMGEKQTAVEAVVSAISDVEECGPTDLEPIQEVIDADALNAVFQKSTSESTAELSVEFAYEGYEVQVTQSGARVTNPAHD